jgi:hypothetical protein
MDHTKIAQALETKFESMDLGEITLRGYLRELLGELLLKTESFSGKRPFGNSGWEYDVATPLIMAGAIKGEIQDGRGDPDWDDFEAVIPELVTAL